MNRFGTIGIIGIAGTAVVATIDAALGLGGGAFLTDICRTFLESGLMADMELEVKHLPLIALSFTVTLAAVSALYYEQRKAAAGFSKPTETEKITIVSAMLAAAASHRTITRAEIMGTYRSVTGDFLDPELVDCLYEESRSIELYPSRDIYVPGRSDSIVRRRAYAAALMIGCVARDPNETTFDILEQLELELGASDNDITSASLAVDTWRGEMNHSSGVSMLNVKWGQRLLLKPSSSDVVA